MESALRILIQASQREIYHNNNGLCPDEMEGYDSRDPDCVVCQAIDAAQGLQAKYDLALSDVTRLTSELAAERKEVERLRSALAKYGWHIGDCNRRMRQFKEPCKCGFESALLPPQQGER